MTSSKCGGQPVKRVQIAFIVLSVILLSQCGRRPEPHVYCGEEAIARLDDETVRALGKVQLTPNKPESHNRLGESYVRKALYILAQTRFREDAFFHENVELIDSLVGKALHAFDASLKLDSGSAMAYRGKGRAFLLRAWLRDDPFTNSAIKDDVALHFLGNAVAILEQAISRDPHLAECWLDLGVAYQHLELTENKADSCYHRFYELDTTGARIHRMVADNQILISVRQSFTDYYLLSGDVGTMQMLQDVHNPDGARAEFSRSIRSVPPIAQGPVWFGVLIFQRSRYEYRRKLWEQFVRSPLHDPLYHFFLEYEYSLHGREGDKDLQRHLLQAHVGNPMGYMYLWWGFQWLYRDTVRRNLDSPWESLYAGRATFDPNTAMGSFERAIAIDKDFSPAHYLLAASILEKDANIEKADELLNSLIDRKFTDSFTLLKSHLLLALVKTRKGNIPEAVKEFAAAVRIDSACVFSNLSLGRYYDLSFALPQDPLSPPKSSRGREVKNASLFNLWIGRRCEWRQERAGRFYAKAVELDPGGVMVSAYLADWYGDGNREDDAISVLHDALQLYPQNSMLRFLLSTHYYRKGELKKAREECRAAMAVGSFQAKFFLERIAAKLR